MLVGHVPADCSVACGPIGLKLWRMVRVGHGFLATRWRPDLPPGGLLECNRCFFSAVSGPVWLILLWMVGVDHRYLATRWRPDSPPGGSPGVYKLFVVQFG